MTVTTLTTTTVTKAHTSIDVEDEGALHPLETTTAAASTPAAPVELKLDQVSFETPSSPTQAVRAASARRCCSTSTCLARLGYNTEVSFWQNLGFYPEFYCLQIMMIILGGAGAGYEGYNAVEEASNKYLPRIITPNEFTDSVTKGVGAFIALITMLLAFRGIGLGFRTFNRFNGRLEIHGQLMKKQQETIEAQEEKITQLEEKVSELQSHAGLPQRKKQSFFISSISYGLTLLGIKQTSALTHSATGAEHKRSHSNTI